MNRRGLKWAAGTVSLALVVLGVHFWWEWHRYRLVTPYGVIRIGMTQAELEALLGRPIAIGGVWNSGNDHLFVSFDDQGRLSDALFFNKASGEITLPRPSLIECVRAWVWPRPKVQYPFGGGHP